MAFREQTLLEGLEDVDNRMCFELLQFGGFLKGGVIQMMMNRIAYTFVG